MIGKHEKPIPCDDHKPVQHRDAKPPWCRKCGLDEFGNEPVSMIGRK